MITRISLCLWLSFSRGGLGSVLSFLWSPVPWAPTHTAKQSLLEAVSMGQSRVDLNVGNSGRAGGDMWPCGQQVAALKGLPARA